MDHDTRPGAALSIDLDQPPHSSAPWPLAERPGYLIRRLHQLHVALFSELTAGFHVTPVQYSLMSAIAARGEADQTTLAADVALDRSTTASSLARLDARGLIARRRGEKDGREMRCALTTEGRSVLAAMEPLAREAHARTLAALPAGQARALIELMHRALPEKNDA
ncbi:MarR family transcriptional regulator [Rhodovarius crocodyli]|uniref:MarR family transcriptional regulator n=2 Tax=Rhodovarius crocodyli TaxID=1979269 RepID=A0A437MFI2_9PROT|nr:MarR family transcriptional regulator [Rhodovarius crocodyli]